MPHAPISITVIVDAPLNELASAVCGVFNLNPVDEGVGEKNWIL
jgi:hypothetical protein